MKQTWQKMFENTVARNMLSLTGTKLKPLISLSITKYKQKPLLIFLKEIILEEVIPAGTTNELSKFIGCGVTLLKSWWKVKPVSTSLLGTWGVS